MIRPTYPSCALIGSFLWLFAALFAPLLAGGAILWRLGDQAVGLHFEGSSVQGMDCCLCRFPLFCGACPDRAPWSIDLPDTQQVEDRCQLWPWYLAPHRQIQAPLRSTCCLSFWIASQGICSDQSLPPVWIPVARLCSFGISSLFFSRTARSSPGRGSSEACDLALTDKKSRSCLRWPSRLMAELICGEIYRLCQSALRTGRLLTDHLGRWRAIAWSNYLSSSESCKPYHSLWFAHYQTYPRSYSRFWSN